jgi:homoserine O-acetyltransferase/O-succinyltransferase
MLQSRYGHIPLIAWAVGLFLGCASRHAVVSPEVARELAPGVAASSLSVSEGDAVFTDVRFRDGKRLDAARVHYATAGVPRRDANGRVSNAVLMLHWTGASGAALRSRPFVESLFAAGKPLDVSRYFVIFIDALGHGRSSKPSDGPHAGFPAYGYEDIVTLQHRVVTETLGLEHLHAIVGLSMGGMNAWRWAERYPDFMDAIVPIVALPERISGRNLVWRRFVIQQIRNDPEWAGGEYAHPPRGWVEAFPVFRMMLDGVEHLHATVRDVASAESFVREARAQALPMDANDILYSLESSSDYAPEAGLEQIRTRVFALNFSDDEFNPVLLGGLESAMRRVPRGVYVIQPGDGASFGHLTQAHPELWAHHLGDFLSRLEEGAR